MKNRFNCTFTYIDERKSMYLAQLSSKKILHNGVELSSSSFKAALGSDTLILFADNEFKPLIDMLKLLNEEYKVIVDVPNDPTSPSVIYESDPSAIISYDDYIANSSRETNKETKFYKEKEEDSDPEI